MVNILKAMGIQQWQRRPEGVGAAVEHSIDATDSHQAEQFTPSNNFESPNESLPDAGFIDTGVASNNLSGSLKQALEQANSPEPISSLERIESPEPLDSLEPINSHERIKTPEPVIENKPQINSAASEPTLPQSTESTTNASKPIINVPSLKSEKTEPATAPSGETDQSAKKRVMPINLSALLGAEAASALDAKPATENVIVDIESSAPPVEVDVPPIEDSMIPPVDEVDEDFSMDVPPLDIGENSWEGLEALLKTNEHCPSCGWGNAFLGSGNQNADLMFIVDAPTSREVQEKTMFAGRAGQLFDAMLLAIVEDRNTVYSTSVFKCAPTDDLTMTPQCDRLLLKQIELVKPKCIVSFGEFAAQAVIKSNLPLEKLRESDQQCSGVNIAVIPTYSPVEMLDNTALKALVWQDLKKLLARSS